MPEMTTLDRTGDTKLIWDCDNADEVTSARQTFNNLKRKGYIAYSVKKSGKKKDVLTSFDPAVEKMILAPPMAGG
jgi:hypothetical protein